MYIGYCPTVLVIGPEIASGPITRTGVSGIFLGVILTLGDPIFRIVVPLGPKLSAYMRHVPYVVI